MGFTTTFQGLAEVETRFRRRIQVLEDLEPDLMVAAQEFGRQEAELFDSGGKGKWAPNTPKTSEYKGGGPVMVRSGALRASLSRPEILSMSSTSIRAGTNVRYAKYHQHGFMQRWALQRFGDSLHLVRRKEPLEQAARPVVDLSPTDKHRLSFQAAMSLRRRLRSV